MNHRRGFEECSTKGSSISWWWCSFYFAAFLSFSCRYL